MMTIRTGHAKHATSAENSQMWGRPLPSPGQPKSRTHASLCEVVGILQHPPNRDDGKQGNPFHSRRTAGPQVSLHKQTFLKPPHLL